MDAVDASPTGETAVPGACEVEFELNGDVVNERVDPALRLVDLLRDRYQLTGTKTACEVGVCGACTVLVDGAVTSSCLTLAVQVDGASVETIEGLSRGDDVRELQELFVEEGGAQCGFCTSGQIAALAALKAAGAEAESDRTSPVDALQGNLCRCTGYYGILRAASRWMA